MCSTYPWTPFFSWACHMPEVFTVIAFVCQTVSQGSGEEECMLASAVRN
jgi:hypothetical protein